MAFSTATNICSTQAKLLNTAKQMLEHHSAVNMHSTIQAVDNICCQQDLHISAAPPYKGMILFLSVQPVCLGIS